MSKKGQEVILDTSPYKYKYFRQCIDNVIVPRYSLVLANSGLDIPHTKIDRFSCIYINSLQVWDYDAIAENTNTLSSLSVNFINIYILD